MNKQEHKTVEQIDAFYEQMASKSKQRSILEGLLYLVTLIVLISLFTMAISRLNEQMSAQITANQKLVDRLDIMEDEMRTLRNGIYKQSNITRDWVERQMVAEVIAKQVNRRTATEQQLQLVESYQAKQQQNPQQEQDSIYFLTRAIEYLKAKKYQQALELVNKAISLDKRVSTPYSVKSEILAKQNKLTEAIAAQTLAIHIEKKLPFSDVLANYYNTRGFLYIKTNQLQKALADFKYGSEISEGDEKSFIMENSALVALYQGQWQQALDITTELLALDVDGGWKWFLRAIAADKLNDKKLQKQALAEWQKTTNDNTTELLKKALANSNLSSYDKWL